MLLLDIDTSDSMQEGVAESDNLRDKMCVGHLTSSGFHCKDDPNLKPQAKSIFSGQSALIDSIEAHEAWSNGFLLKMSTIILLILGHHDRCRWFISSPSKFTRLLAHYRTWLTHQASNAVTVSPTDGTHHPWDEEKRRRHIPLQNVSNYLHYWIRLKRDQTYDLQVDSFRSNLTRQPRGIEHRQSHIYVGFFLSLRLENYLWLIGARSAHSFHKLAFPRLLEGSLNTSPIPACQ